MSRLLVTVCLIGASLLPTILYAQNPPFQNPALDSNCYFPQFGNSQQLDSIQGWGPYQQLGAPYIRNLGPAPNGDYGKLLISDLTPPSREGVSTMSAVKTGKSFNLHQMQQQLQRIDPAGLALTINGAPFVLCHLRDRSHVEIFTGRIYWSDDDGNYDSSRYTDLNTNIPLGDRDGSVWGPLTNWYVAHVMSLAQLMH